MKLTTRALLHACASMVAIVARILPARAGNLGDVLYRRFAVAGGVKAGSDWRLCVSLGVMLLVAGSPTVTGAQTAEPRDLKAIVESGVLRVGMTRFDLPAFHRKSGNALIGPEVELARQLGQALGIKVEIVDNAASFDAVVNGVASGATDIGISKLSQTYYRLARVRFSDPYIMLRHGLLFNRATIAAEAKGQPPEQMLRQFSGRIGVIARSAYVDFARRNFPRAQLFERANWNVVIEGLRDGSLDAIYRDEFEIKRLLKIRPVLNVRFGAAVITDQHALLSVAICDTCAKLREIINYHLTQTRGAFTLQGLLASDLRD